MSDSFADYFDEDVDDFIAHYGKKGMKWGVTKTEARTALDTSRTQTGDAFRGRYKKTRKDGTQKVRKTKVALSVLDVMATGGAYTGFQATRAAGFPRGQATAIAILGGGTGSALASAVKTRNNARRAVGDS